MHEDNQKKWYQVAYGWIGVSITLILIIVSGVQRIEALSNQIALLNQKIEFVTGDHEKRISKLEQIVTSLSQR